MTDYSTLIRWGWWMYPEQVQVAHSCMVACGDPRALILDRAAAEGRGMFYTLNGRILTQPRLIPPDIPSDQLIDFREAQGLPADYFEENRCES